MSVSKSTTTHDWYNEKEIVVTAIVGRVAIGNGDRPALAVAFDLAADYIGENMNGNPEQSLEATFTAYGHTFVARMEPGA